MKATRGGARPGAGRKPTGAKTVSTMFCLSLETFAGLKTAITPGLRSKFVDAAIREKLVTFTQAWTKLHQDALALTQDPKAPRN